MQSGIVRETLKVRKILVSFKNEQKVRVMSLMKLRNHYIEITRKRKELKILNIY